MAESRKPLTYAELGVDIDVGNRIVDRIRPFARATRRSGAGAELGGFGGLFDLRAAGFVDPILVAANDGVGTKVKIAIESGLYDTIGVDLVAMCVNDIVVQGAEPLFFLDYFASGKLDEDVASAVVQGIAEGCAQSGCALIGGETAEMPGLYALGDFDIAGFAVGAAERGTLLPRPGLKPGDLVFGLPSSGVHSNGFSLVRRIVARSGLGWDDSAPFDPQHSLAAALLTPTRLYVRPLLDALKRTRGIHALAHITGGGYPDNLPRVLDDGLAVSLDLNAFTPQPVFSWLAVGRRPRRSGDAAHLQLRLRDGGVRFRRLQGRSAGSPGGRWAVAGPDWRACSWPGPAPCHSREAQAVTPRVRTAVLISGRGSNMSALIEAARSPDFSAEIVLVLSDDPAALGLSLARKLGVAAEAIDFRAYAGKPAFEAALDARLTAASVEIVCLAGFMRVLSPPFVERWRGRMLNIHPSLLPNLRGLNTHERALAQGLAEHGCTVHLVTAELDAGPILAQARVPVLPGDDAAALAARVLKEEHRIYPQALDELARSLRAAP